MIILVLVKDIYRYQSISQTMKCQHPKCTLTVSLENSFIVNERIICCSLAHAKELINSETSQDPGEFGIHPSVETLTKDLSNVSLVEPRPIRFNPGTHRKCHNPVCIIWYPKSQQFNAYDLYCCSTDCLAPLKEAEDERNKKNSPSHTFVKPSYSSHGNAY